MDHQEAAAPEPSHALADRNGGLLEAWSHDPDIRDVLLAILRQGHETNKLLRSIDAGLDVLQAEVANAAPPDYSPQLIGIVDALDDISQTAEELAERMQSVVKPRAKRT